MSRPAIPLALLTILLGCGVDRSLSPPEDAGGGGGSSGSSSGGTSGSGSGSSSGTGTGSGSGVVGSSSGSSSGSGSGGSGSSGSGSGVVPGCDDGGYCTVPPSSTGSPTGAVTAQNFALRHLHLGDELDSSGNLDWYLYGYNIDKTDTIESSTDVCTLAVNANPRNQIDGPGGLDNSFGQNIVSTLLTAVESNPSAAADTALAGGQTTILFDVTGLAPSAGQTATGLTGMVFAGVPFGQGPNAASAVPTWTTADNWPLDPSYVTSAVHGTTLAQPVTSKENFTGAYVVNGVFVSGQPTDVTLSIPFGGVLLKLPIQHAIITFNHTGAAGSASSLSGGVISGVVDAQAMVNSMRAVAGDIESALCSGSVFEELATSILQAADIMDDGTNVAGTPCNGISIGIGFDAAEIGLPKVVGTPATAANPCADAGP